MNEVEVEVACRMPSSQPTKAVPAHPVDPADPATAIPAIPAPRKRRKRTAGSGAAEDCFTCASRGTKCDRRRPYCTQCLDLGKDCSGYKTTLTWGVGVASRGKLRGLSLPVSGAQAVVSPERPRKQSASDTKSHQPRARRTSSVVEAGPSKTGSVQKTVTTESQFSNTSANHQGASEWPQSRSADLPNGPSYADQSPVLNRFPSHTPLSDSGVGINDDFPNALPADSVPGHRRVTSSISEPWVPVYTPSTDYPPTNGLSVGAFSPSIPWPPAVTGKRHAEEEEDDVEQVYSAPSIYSDQSSVASYTSNSWFLVQSPFVSSLPDMLLEQSVGRTPRIRYLISYFSEVIAPVIVAFDSPTNPYRTRILRLAQQSETLQHAISALSASNLRQRREAKILSTERTGPAKMSSMAHRALTDTSFQDRYGIRDPQDPTREELYHKSMAIKSLNAQLADPALRHQDSVLATLLILCLFHICETGVAQFQTQFAGVRKLLAMRSRSGGIESEEARWCTRMFTWFDAMTATINDREGQLQGAYVDKSCLSDEEWAMENLAGCDGRLFKIIARLGRLNMLSQNQPVKSSSGDAGLAATPVVPPSLSHYTMNMPLQPSPMDTTEAFLPLLPDGQPDRTRRSEFWTEWHSIRQQLESWRLDTTSFGAGYDVSSLSPSNSCASLSPSVGTAPTFSSPPLSPVSQYFVDPSNLVDLSNISESFRYAALLYTERLAFPDIPSHHHRIQNLVLTALHYITTVHSDVYLLWPLFITGAECVYDEHREVIRQRCKDIQKDSGFFNNISCLELLEKIWARNPTVKAADLSFPSYTNIGGLPVSNVRGSSPADPSQPCARLSNGFKWRSIIQSEGLDGEYIVV